MSFDFAVSNHNMNVIVNRLQAVSMLIIRYAVVTESLPSIVELQHIVGLLTNLTFLKSHFSKKRVSHCTIIASIQLT